MPPKKAKHRAKEGVKIQAFCMKERKKVTMKDPKPETMKNGRPAFKGECPNCGTKLFKIAAAKDLA